MVITTPAIIGNNKIFAIISRISSSGIIITAAIKKYEFKIVTMDPPQKNNWLNNTFLGSNSDSCQYYLKIEFL